MISDLTDHPYYHLPSILSDGIVPSCSTLFIPIHFFIFTRAHPLLLLLFFIFEILIYPCPSIALIAIAAFIIVIALTYPHRRHLNFTRSQLFLAFCQPSYPLPHFRPFTARPALSTRAPRPSAPRHPLNSTQLNSTQPTQRTHIPSTFLPLRYSLSILNVTISSKKHLILE